MLKSKVACLHKKENKERKKERKKCSVVEGTLSFGMSICLTFYENGSQRVQKGLYGQTWYNTVFFGTDTLIEACNLSVFGGMQYSHILTYKSIFLFLLFSLIGIAG